MVKPEHILVRPAGYADVDALTEFSAALAQETEGRRLHRQRLREGSLAVLDSPERGFYMVAELHTRDLPRIVGQLMVTFEWSDWRNGLFWWVQSVYVDPAWRRQGVYRTMYGTLLARAKADPQVCGIRLYVEQHNQIAQTVYQRVGLAPSGYSVFEQDFVLPKTIDHSHKTDT